jgi:hypothetical protein
LNSIESNNRRNAIKDIVKKSAQKDDLNNNILGKRLSVEIAPMHIRGRRIGNNFVLKYIFFPKK